MSWHIDGIYCQSETTGLTRYSRSLIEALDRDWRELAPGVEGVVFGLRGGRQIPIPLSALSYEYLPASERTRLYLTALFGRPNLVSGMRRGVRLVHFHDATRFCADVPGVATLVTVHDIASVTTSHYGRRSRWLKQRALRRIEQSRCRVIVSSEFTARELAGNTSIESSRVVAIPLGVSSVFHAPPPSERPDPGPGAPFVLYVGTAHPRKNLRRLLRAYPLWHRETGIALVLVGRGLREALSATPEYGALTPAEAAAVQFVGPVTDEALVGLYQRAGCLLFPSLHEGFGLPAAEAMRCGCPVVCTGCGALGEVVGDAALIVDPYDEEAMAHAVCQATTNADARARMRAAGLARSERYTWQNVAAQVVREYARLSSAT